MINHLKLLLDYIYKKKCYFCSSSKENNIFCNSCYEKISCFSPKSINFIGSCPIYAVSFYNDITKKLIRGLKYHNQKELAYYQAKIMYDFWSKITGKEENYIVLPVPLHKKRLKKRRYNHIELVAKEFCKLTGYQFENNLIQRIKDTKSQYKLTRQQREINLKDAFKVSLKNFKDFNNLPVLILDDITTTGSTFKEIINELEKNNIMNITAFATSIPESSYVEVS